MGSSKCLPRLALWALCSASILTFLTPHQHGVPEHGGVDGMSLHTLTGVQTLAGMHTCQGYLSKLFWL